MKRKKEIVVTRRQVLRGAGGFTLGLPFLPSLVPGKAYAQNVSAPVNKNFVCICFYHGGVREVSMFPDPAVLTNTANIATGHAGRWGQLALKTQGTNASLSPVLTAPAAQLTARLASKMNVLWGVDYAFGGGHQTGGNLGNYAATDGAPTAPATATIDQVMAWSPNFYKDLGGVKVRSMVGPSGGDSSGINGHSWTWSSPSTHSGNIQRSAGVGSPNELFQALFAGQTQNPVAQRKPIVDRVIQDYRRIRDSNRRMTPDDKQRLNDHMDRMSEVQRLVQSLPPPASCANIRAPANIPNPNYKAFNEVFAAAFLCGASRIGVIGVHEGLYIPFPGSWHQDTAHKWDQPDAQARMVAADQMLFQEVFLDLVRKLDVEVAPGQTLLDNSLVEMINECGEETHSSPSIPIVTAGSAGGFFKTGLFCDYRNTAPATKSKFRGQYGAISGYPGISSNRWLGTILQSMGIQKSEYETGGNLGYADPHLDPIYAATYLPAVMAQHGDVMPFLKA